MNFKNFIVSMEMGELKFRGGILIPGLIIESMRVLYRSSWTGSSVLNIGASVFKC